MWPFKSKKAKELEALQEEQQLKKAEIAVLEAHAEKIRLENLVSQQRQQLLANEKLKNLYDATVPTDFHTPKFDNLNINDTLAIEGQSLMQQARNAVANNPIAAAIIHRYQALLVGKNGYSLQPQPLDLDGKVDEELAKRLSTAWSKFCRNPAVNAKNLNFMGVLNLIVSSWLTDGDCFAQIIRDYKKGEFKIRLWTADCLDYNSSSLVNIGAKSTRPPIEVDEYGVPTKYYFKVKSVDKTQVEKVIPVDGNDVLHILDKREPEQLRGVPVFANSFLLMEQVKVYMSNEIIASSLSAQILGTLQQVSTDVIDQNPKIKMGKLGHDIGYFKVPPGYNLTFNNATTRVNQVVDAYTKAMLRQIGSGTALDAESLSNSFESSYSAARQSMIYTELKAASKINILISTFVQPLYTAFVDFYMDMYELGVTSKNDYSWIDNVIINKPRSPSIDPVKDATANKLNLQLGITTLDKLANEAGGNINDNLNAIADLKHRCDELGIEELYNGLYDFEMPTESGNSGGPQSSEEDEEQDTEQQEQQEDAKQLDD
ncbi:hypothetical protein CKF54_00440 [Psittacicella hinzii]|uniref:Portal protein n=1 Tax=Psittacicella hinzii TaxID=2028575 RepID=A0A3A1YBF3_9GAMM|nr:phage portal protein [Psittacicella hinzii]RIY34498.1 hypothetical protein CKF54_00440 [Psittacicella hinzii]